jgi:hypothetical protein
VLAARLSILTAHAGDAQTFEEGFRLPPCTPSRMFGLFNWTVATAIESRLRPCPLSEWLRLLRRDDLSLLQYLVSSEDSRNSITASRAECEVMPAAPCCLCFDSAAIVHPCSRADGSHGLCGSCAVQSLRFALSQVRTHSM